MERIRGAVRIQVRPEEFERLLAPQPVRRGERQEFDEAFCLLQSQGRLIDDAVADRKAEAAEQPDAKRFGRSHLFAIHVDVEAVHHRGLNL